MTTGIANSKTTDEAQIRALIDDRAKAVRDKDRKRAEDWFSSFEGPIGYEIRDHA